MRIICSKIHDYYDKVQALGFDSQVLFRRVCEHYTQDYDDTWRVNGEAIKAPPAAVAEFKAFAQQYMPGRASWVGKEQVTVDWGLTLVAGRFFPFAQLALERKSYLEPQRYRFIYSAAEYEAMLEARYVKSKDSAVAKRAAFFNLGTSTQLLEWATRHRVAIIRYTQGPYGGVTINARLADQELFRVLDAYQAAQELEMFLGNLATPVRTPEPLPDKYRVRAHGFDEQSFRKRPT